MTLTNDYVDEKNYRSSNLAMLNANPSQASYFNKSTFEVDKQYLVDKENNSGGNSYCNQMTPSQLNGNSSGNDLNSGMRSIQQDD